MADEKIFWGGGALLAPVPPVLVTCGTMEQANVLTVGWTGICATHPPMTYISVRPTRHSYQIIKDSGEFAINLTTTAMTKTVDFCGVKSGKNTDKIKVCGLHLLMPERGTVPILAEIIGTAVDARFVDSKGKLNLQQSGLLAYAHGEYFALGRKCGEFGFSVKKKSRKPPAQTGKRTNLNAKDQ